MGVNDMTEAYIGFSAQTATTGTHANAGGNVVVDATDDTVAYLVTGSLAIGLDLAGIGGAVVSRFSTKPPTPSSVASPR